jgi:hypothetical protein
MMMLSRIRFQNLIAPLVSPARVPSAQEDDLEAAPGFGSASFACAGRASLPVAAQTTFSVIVTSH